VDMRVTKEQVIELVTAMPDDATVEDVMEELFFKLQVDDGLAQLDRGEHISHEEVERRLARWLSP
jgi:predicted transcriptional regulator